MEERIIMKIFVIFLALLLIIPLVHSQVQIENSTSFRIGYSSEKLFSSDLGMLSYLLGETFCLQVSGSLMFELHY